MSALHLSHETIAEIKKQLSYGRSLVTVAKELANRSATDVEQALSVVCQIAEYVPTVPHWHLGSHRHAGDRLVAIKRVYACPSIVLLDNVLSMEECDEIVIRGKELLQPSLIVDCAERKNLQERRSETAYLQRGMDTFIATLDVRCSAIMDMPVENGESLQVVRYQPGGEYRPHYDFFRAVPNNASGGNRIATLLIYLNDVEEGGETFFPGLNLTVRPSKGSAIFFHYIDQQGRFDNQTLHGGAPVIRGEKWIVTKWMRQGKHAI